MAIEDVKFKTPDRVVAYSVMAALAALTIGAGVGLYLILPLLIELAANALYFAGEIAALVVVGLGFVQLWLSREAFKLKMLTMARNARRHVAKENPVATIDVSLTIFKNKQTAIDDLQGRANGALIDLKNKLHNNKKTGMLDQAEAEDKLADAAESLAKPQEEIAQHATKAERWRKGAASIQPMVDDQEFIKSQLGKARVLTERAIDDLENQKVVLTAQYEAYQLNQQQVRLYKKMFGKSPELENIDYAVEAIEQQTTETQGQIEQLMSQLTPRIQAEQLKREADAQEAMRLRAERHATVQITPAAQQARLTEGAAPTVTLSDKGAAVKVGERR